MEKEAQNMHESSVTYSKWNQHIKCVMMMMMMINLCLKTDRRSSENAVSGFF